MPGGGPVAGASTSIGAGPRPACSGLEGPLELGGWYSMS